MCFGNFSLYDISDNRKLVDVDPASIREDVKRAVSAHNEIVNELTGQLCAPIASSTYPMNGYPEDDLNKSSQGFPLVNSLMAANWDRLFFESKTMEELSFFFRAVINSDVKRIQRSVQRAVYFPDKGTVLSIAGANFDKTELLDVYPFCNGDDRKLFGDNKLHSHYMATQDWTEYAIRTLISNVTEHGIHEKVQLYVNINDVDKIPGSSTIKNISGFHSNYVLGTFDGHEVWVKPWILPNTMVAIDTGHYIGFQSFKPLGMRSVQELTILENENSYIKGFQRVFSIAPLYPWMAAIIQFGSDSYTVHKENNL